MTRNEISLLLNLSVFPDVAIDVSWKRHAIDGLMSNGLVIQDVDANANVIYKVTERGRVFIDYITDLELPVQTWSMP